MSTVGSIRTSEPLPQAAVTATTNASSAVAEANATGTKMGRRTDCPMAISYSESPDPVREMVTRGCTQHCPSCFGLRSISFRTRSSEARCGDCRRGHVVTVAAFHCFWLERFTVEEIEEMARSIWGTDVTGGPKRRASSYGDPRSTPFLAVGCAARLLRRRRSRTPGHDHVPVRVLDDLCEDPRTAAPPERVADLGNLLAESELPRTVGVANRDER